MPTSKHTHRLRSTDPVDTYKRIWGKGRTMHTQAKFEGRKLILHYYRMFSGRRVLRQSDQYITLAGDQTDKFGELHPLGEYQEMCQAGLISSPRKQWYGIDKRSDYVIRNQRVAPEANWVRGDIFKEMSWMHFLDNLRPAIVNLDLMSFPKAAARQVAKMMDLLARKGCHGVLLVVNVMIQNMHHPTHNPDELFDFLRKDSDFVRAVKEGTWKASGGWDCYNGNSAKMATTFFYKA
jgi:hypothetical protein